MTCDELLKAMNEYVDGNIEPAHCAEFEQHLAGCNPCQVVVDNIRKTITLYRAGERFEMPAAFRQHLHQKLKDRWRTSFGESSPQ
jgi:anti-sigma factor RsiW